MLSRKSGTPAGVTIAGSGQNRSKDFSWRAQQPAIKSGHPRTTTMSAEARRPPPMPKAAPHLQAEHTGVAPSRTWNKPSRRSKQDTRNPCRCPPSSPPTGVDAEALNPSRANGRSAVLPWPPAPTSRSNAEQRQDRDLAPRHPQRQTPVPRARAGRRRPQERHGPPTQIGPR